MREFNSRYDVEDYARQLARDTVADYVRTTKPEDRDYSDLLDQVSERVDGCEAVIFPYHAALTVLCGRSSEHVSEVPRTLNNEDWSDYTQRCAYAILLEIAGDFVGDYYDAVKPYHEEEDA